MPDAKSKKSGDAAKKTTNSLHIESKKQQNEPISPQTAVWEAVPGNLRTAAVADKKRRAAKTNPFPRMGQPADVDIYRVRHRGPSRSKIFTA